MTIADRRALVLELHMALGGAHAHAGQGVDDNAQPFAAAQLVVPVRRFIAVHALQHVFPVWPLQGGFNFRSQGERFLNAPGRSEEHTSELQSLMRISYAVFCLKKKT